MRQAYEGMINSNEKIFYMLNFFIFCVKRKNSMRAFFLISLLIRYRMDSQYSIRNATLEEVIYLVANWGEEEGWLPTPTGGEMFLLYGSDRIFVGKLMGK